MEAPPSFDTIEEAVAELKAGRMVVLLDDENRENEGDLCCAAEKTTPEIVNFMATHGRGLICLTLTERQVERLNLAMMTPRNDSRFGTNFTVSIEAARGITTGISAGDRATTILTAADPEAVPEAIATPGHVFPLKARPGGVLQRAGQTEGSVDLAMLAGLNPAGVICEIMNDDGTMARYPELKAFSRKHGLKMVTVKDLIKYRLNKQTQILLQGTSSVSTVFGRFDLHIYGNSLLEEYYLAFTKGSWQPDDVVPVRVCKPNALQTFLGGLGEGTDTIRKTLALIGETGRGALICIFNPDRFLRHPFPGVQNESRSESRKTSSPHSEFRDYGFGAQVMRELGLRKIRLITNNPRKLVGLEAYGIQVEGVSSF